MPYTPHEQLEPASQGTLWKFMTFEFFSKLVDSETLHFHQIGDFEDVFEGTYPIANKKLRPQIYTGGVIPKQTDYDLIERMVRSNSYACCFHRRKFETAFMWKQYGNDGVVIKTTVPRLKKCFHVANEKVYISPVFYIDYENKFLPEGNMYYLAFHKRRSFESEKELRALVWSEEPGVGLQIKVDLSELFYEIYAALGKEGLAHAIETLLNYHRIMGVRSKYLICIKLMI